MRNPTPELHKLAKLDHSAEPGNGPDPVIMLQIFINSSVLPARDLEEFRAKVLRHHFPLQLSCKKRLFFSVAKDDGSSCPEKVPVRVVTRELRVPRFIETKASEDAKLCLICRGRQCQDHLTALVDKPSSS